MHRPGRFQLQAAIAAVHAEAKSYDATDWPQIVALYGLLRKVRDLGLQLLSVSCKV